MSGFVQIVNYTGDTKEEEKKLRGFYRGTFRDMMNMFRRSNFPGFTAARCGECKKTANVPGYYHGWMCQCGHHNEVAWGHMEIPYEFPHMGPDSVEIQMAVAMTHFCLTVELLYLRLRGKSIFMLQFTPLFIIRKSFFKKLAFCLAGV